MGISFWRQTITRIRPGQKDIRGSIVPDWNNADTLEISGCSVQPATTSLSQDGRILGVSEGLIAYVPASADIKAGDKIVYSGNEYAISGEPQMWPSASGGMDHWNLNLVRWEG